MDDGIGCLATEASCDALDPSFLSLAADAPATGSITFSSLSPGAATVDISVSVASSTFTGSGSVDQVNFTNVTYTASNVPVTVSPVFLTLVNVTQNTSPAVTGTVAGTVEAFQGATSLGSSPFSLTVVDLNSLNCLADSSALTATCGFTFGDGGFRLSLGGAGDHVFEHTFNVSVPAPSTSALLGVGGALMLLSRRRR